MGWWEEKKSGIPVNINLSRPTGSALVDNEVDGRVVLSPVAPVAVAVVAKVGHGRARDVEDSRRGLNALLSVAKVFKILLGNLVVADAAEATDAARYVGVRQGLPRLDARAGRDGPDKGDVVGGHRDGVNAVCKALGNLDGSMGRAKEDGEGA